jgi:SAM-dependent methyltransferase
MARDEMRRRGLEFITPKYLRALRKAHLFKGANVGDRNKGWDVLRTIQFLEQNVEKTWPILDVGAYGSEILCGLHKLGFSDLTGMDLNPRVTAMPYAGSIRYQVGDFTNTRFASSAFCAVTAISVLEHGFNSSGFFREFARILKPGGYLLCSVDYWPEKIDTSGIKAFGLDWMIFSRQDLLELLEDAHRFNFVPVGPLNFQACERTANWCNRKYTYAWVALQKTSNC